MNSKSNKIDPRVFTDKLERAVGALYDLFELCREVDSGASDSPDAGAVDPAFIGCYEVANQYARPTEFLQTLLDILRVIFEPTPIGTWLLNGNRDFLFDALPNHPFQLGYATLTGDDDQPFEQFWQETVLPYLSECGYAYETAVAVFGVVSTRIDRFNIQAVDDALNVVGAGFSPEEALGIMAAYVDEVDAWAGKSVHFGFCLDPALGSKRRLSLWLVLPIAKAGKTTVSGWASQGSHELRCLSV